MSAAGRGTRSEPFHCPYCGEEDLRPHDADPGSWECHACLRAFSVSLLGHLRRPAGAGAAGPEAAR